MEFLRWADADKASVHELLDRREDGQVVWYDSLNGFARGAPEEIVNPAWVVVIEVPPASLA